MIKALVTIRQWYSTIMKHHANVNDNRLIDINSMLKRLCLKYKDFHTRRRDSSKDVQKSCSHKLWRVVLSNTTVCCVPKRYRMLCSQTLPCVVFPNATVCCVPKRYRVLCSQTLPCVVFPNATVWRVLKDVYLSCFQTLNYMSLFTNATVCIVYVLRC